MHTNIYIHHTYGAQITVIRHILATNELCKYLSFICNAHTLKHIFLEYPLVTIHKNFPSHILLLLSVCTFVGYTLFAFCLHFTKHSVRTRYTHSLSVVIIASLSRYDVSTYVFFFFFLLRLLLCAG